MHFLEMMFWLTISLVVVTLILMLFWNMILPELFGFKRIGFWQSFRLFIIGLILTGGLNISAIYTSAS